jgi:hypothetical protein
MLDIVHGVDGRFRPEDRAQGACEVLELGRQLPQQSGIVMLEPVVAAQIAGVGVDLDGKKHREVLAPEAAVQRCEASSA